MGYEALRQLDIALQNTFAVGQLLQVEVLPQDQQALLLAREVGGELCLLQPQFGEAHTGVDGSAGVNGLLGVDHKLVAKVGRVKPMHFAEVAIHEQGVANKTGGKASVDVGKALAARRFHPLAGYLNTRLARAYAAIGMLQKAKHLADGELAGGLGGASNRQGNGKHRGQQLSFKHNKMMFSLFSGAKVRSFRQAAHH